MRKRSRRQQCLWGRALSPGSHCLGAPVSLQALPSRVPPVLGCLHKLGFSSTSCGSCRPCRAVCVALFGFPEPFRRWEMLCVPCLPLSASVILTPLSALPPTPPPPPPQEGPGFHVGGSGLHPQHLEQSVSGGGSTRQCCRREVWFLWPFLQGIQGTCILLYS